MNEVELKGIISSVRDLTNRVSADSSLDIDVSSTDYTHEDPNGFFLYVGVAGVVQFDDISGRNNQRTLIAGYHPIRMKKVYTANTTATDLAVIW